MEISNKSFFFEGDHRAVILFHSFTSDPIDNRTLARAINREGYTVYGPTFSKHDDEKFEAVLEINPRQWFKDGEEAVGIMKNKGYSSIVVAGVSLGGIVATNLVVNHSELKGGGTFCSPMIKGFDTNTPIEFWERFMNEKKKEGLSKEVIDSYQDDITQKVVKVLDGLDLKKEEILPKLGDIRCPMFVAQGGKDQTIDPTQAYDFKEQLKNAKVSFHWYQDGEHLITMGNYRKQLLNDFLLFLEEIDW